MADKKLIYVRFVRPKYIGGKSELLKVQIEILQLKKLMKDLTLTRAKKIHYKNMLEETVMGLRSRINRLDQLMPDDDISSIKESKIPVKKKEIKENNNVVKVEQKPQRTLDRDDIEEELLRIKQKLNLLNRV